MDNHRSAVDKKFALKLLNQYADSYQLLHSQHKLLEGEIKDLKINIKINKEIISNFLTKSSLSEKNHKNDIKTSKSNRSVTRIERRAK